MKKIFIGFLISMFGLSFLHGIESVIGSIFILLGINELNEDEHCFTNAALFAKIMIFYYAAVCLCGFAGINFFSTAVGTLVSFAFTLLGFVMIYKIIAGYGTIETNNDIDLDAQMMKNYFVIWTAVNIITETASIVIIALIGFSSGIFMSESFSDTAAANILSTFGDGFGWSFSIIILIMSFISLIFYIKIIIKLYKAYKIYYEAKKE